MSDQFIVCHRTEFAMTHAESVSEDRIGVGNFAHLFKKVADVNNTDTVVPQASDQIKEMGHIVALQAAGRLVHEDDVGPRRHGATDLNNLLRRDR